ncbi:glycoside hydrolase family 97 protein [Pelobium manganitolerans]|nr:glycoside hydrolase family 97 protein [Pelobium manganitolerans]
MGATRDKLYNISGEMYFKSVYKNYVLIGLLLILSQTGLMAQKLNIQSPNKKIKVALLKEQTGADKWFLRVYYGDTEKKEEVIPRIDLGLSRSDQDFADQLKFIKAGNPVLVTENYSAIHGKKSINTNAANEVVVSFQNPSKSKLNIIIRAYNDGVAFRYQFPESGGNFVVKDELTAYTVPPQNKRWLQKWNPANEGLYTAMEGAKNTVHQEWCYPALFNSETEKSWFLLHEAGLDETYCGTKLSDALDTTKYKLTFPNPQDGAGQGEVLPKITLPWKSPWRVIVMGSLADIVSSTLVDDVSPPSAITDTSWIKPGAVSWNYWSNNHGTKDFKVVTDFADLAARMDWPYTLLDWEWDAMGNGGNLEDAAKYILAKGVKPLLWYNSGGKHTYVPATPKDRMLTHENRVQEFTKLKKMGFVGVKIDFFESEKQDMIKYYLDILKDAADFEMMVYFHGCIVPRGWTKTYPNLMTYEAVRGAEWYNNGPELTATAPSHNATLPFTRNVVGAMDYTPVTFTNSQYPHTTSYGHELALSVLFESGLQHFADRPSGYDELPDAPKSFLKTVPVSWDDTKLLDGYPGKEVIIARRKGSAWYIGGINGESRTEKTKKISLSFLPQGTKYKLLLIADGPHDKAFFTRRLLVDSASTVDVRLLRRGGFAASLIPLEN